jgi:TonB family protein
MKKNYLLLSLMTLLGCAWAQLPAQARDAAVALDLRNATRGFDSHLKPYMIALRSKIQKCWIPSTLKTPLQVQLRFEVTPNGEATKIEVTATSGQPGFDETATEAIKRAAPLRRPPQPDGLEIDATFDNRFVDPDDIARARMEQQQKDSTPAVPANSSSQAPQNQQNLLPNPAAQNNFSSQQSGTNSYGYPPSSPQQQQSMNYNSQSAQYGYPPLGQPAYQTAAPPSFGNSNPSALPPSSGYPGAFTPPGGAQYQQAPQNTFRPNSLQPYRNSPAQPAPRSALTPQQALQQMIPTEWLTSGRDGTHSIRKVTDDGHFLLLDDGSLWKSEDESESDGWSRGDEVFVHGDTIINLSQSSEKIEASCEERACSLIAESYVKGSFEGSDKPIVLDNGMIFEASNYHYHYAYHPEATVLVTRFRGVALYKVIIDDEIYDCHRLR